nr:winged helix-turn-helix domain-containing protein [Streptomyces antibioticus]
MFHLRRDGQLTHVELARRVGLAPPHVRGSLLFHPGRRRR